VAAAKRDVISPIVHSMAMERYCPNRRLCEEFLNFIQSPEAQAELRRLGFASPASLQARKR
jgi:molybdate transport system substrate-binding protein